MDVINRATVKELLQLHEPPCISIYMPAHRGGAERDPILLRKNLTQARERLVGAGLRGPNVDDWLAPAHALLADGIFWKNQSDGLALFLTPRFFRAFRLPLAFDNLVVAGSRFHLKPLLPMLTGDGRFFVLSLSKNAVRLLQGTHYSVAEVDLKKAPKNLAEALVLHDSDEMLNFHGRRSGGGSTWGAVFSGHGVGIDDAKDDLLLYFRKIDEALTPYLREEKAPLILACVDYLQPIYREANGYAHLVPQGIHGNPDHLSAKELHDRAWPLVAPLFAARRDKAIAQYERLRGTDHVSSQLEKVLPAAYQGHVETLFVPQGRQMWGVFDAARATTELQPEVRYENVDLLDLAAAFTLAHGHSVYVMAPDQMPGLKAIAAIFHVPPPKHEGKRP